ncbi:MAG: hypothetical protein JWM16_1237 [Verrucomicrobiales bacterium]|nr:hypothetical protein [Verrucomicrobiales bacterium]
MRTNSQVSSWFVGAFVSVVWLALVVLGLTLLFRNQTAPGFTADAPTNWPHETRLNPVPGQSTLLMMAHPQCPCTRASMSELALLMAACQGHVRAYVLFYAPEGSADSWIKTDLWANAARIPGVVVQDDAD